ncbi:hypothetical protein [Sphingobacterium rhinopitheci]|uniref:hypothetical protein n=1 Tax=Sphingobacterium rhinopitheci TaxID=2781960 RepID=UPI001F5219F8|nr:hypothetical protein [Sphingobacterium rhinopitheci]MCI0922520.1 hypothetical protein [Sphingobacterium rhinopitheci]
MSLENLNSLNTCFEKLTNELAISDYFKKELIKTRRTYQNIEHYNDDWGHLDFKETDNFKDFTAYVEYSYYEILTYLDCSDDVSSTINHIEANYHLSFLQLINDYLEKLLQNKQNFTEDDLDKINDINYYSLIKLNYLFDKKTITNFFEHSLIKNQKAISNLKKENELIKNMIIEANDIAKDIDYSKSPISDRIIILDKLGILDLLKLREKNININKLAKLISYLIGSKQTTVQPFLNGLKDNIPGKSPYINEKEQTSESSKRVNNFLKEFHEYTK